MTHNKFKKFSEEEIDLLIQHLDDKRPPYKELSKLLGRDVRSLVCKICSLRKEDILREPVCRVFTAYENNFIKWNSRHMTSEEIGEYLGRTKSSIDSQRTKFNKLNPENRKYKRLSEHHDEIVKLAKQGLYRKDIARKIGCSIEGITKYMKKHGIIYCLRPKYEYQQITRNYIRIDKERGRR